MKKKIMTLALTAAMAASMGMTAFRRTVGTEHHRLVVAGRQRLLPGIPVEMAGWK